MPSSMEETICFGFGQIVTIHGKVQFCLQKSFCALKKEMILDGPIAIMINSRKKESLLQNMEEWELRIHAVVISQILLWAFPVIGHQMILYFTKVMPFPIATKMEHLLLFTDLLIARPIHSQDIS